MVLSIAPISMIGGVELGMKVYATSKTAEDAIAWVKSKKGKAIDYDKQKGAQCVDLIMAYYKYLGVTPSGGNGCDYAKNKLPKGWTRTKGGIPQKGDILVYKGNESNKYGHVAIYESKKVLWHGRFDGKGKVQKTTNIKYNKLNNPYWGCIHPNFSSGVKTTTFNSLSYDIAANKLVIKFTKPSGSNVQINISDDYDFSSSVSTLYKSTAANTSKAATINGNKIAKNKTYYVRIRTILDNGKTSNWSEIKSVSTKKVRPSIADNGASSITSSSVKLSCVVKNPSGYNITECGVQIRKAGGSWEKYYKETLNKTNTSISLSFEIGKGKKVDHELVPGTTYEYRFFVKFDGTEEWLDAFSDSTYPTFKTTGTKPTARPKITDKGASNITSSSVKLSCDIYNPSGYTLTACAVQIRKAGGSWEKYSKIDISQTNTSLSYSFEIGSGKTIDHELVPGTTYEYRFCVKFNGTEEWLDAFSDSTYPTFKTTGTKPTARPKITDKGASNITSSSVKLSCDIYNPSGYTLTACAVQIRKAGGSWEKYSKIDISQTNTSLSYSFEIGSGKKVDHELVPGTTYEYRFCVKYNKTESWSQTSGTYPTFKTTGTKPTARPKITDKGASNITSSSVKLSCDIYNPSGYTLTACAVQIRKAGGSWEKYSKIDISQTNTSLSYSFEIGSGKEVDHELVSGTTYEYRFCVKYNDTESWSQTSGSYPTFTTQ